MRVFALCALSLMATGGMASAQETRTVAMPFEQCLMTIDRTAEQLATSPIPIVDVPGVRMVRFCTAEGSVIVTCSEPDQLLAITQSPQGC